MSILTPRQQPQGRAASVSDIWYLSYDVPSLSHIAGHGPARQEIEVHVHQGASSFRLANMRSTANQHPRPPTRRNDYGRSWPWTRTGQEWDESIIEISAERSTLQDNNHTATDSPSGAPAGPHASDDARRTDTATGRPTRNMVVNLTTAEDSPSYRQFLARIAADERNTRAAIANRRNEQPATARPVDDQTPIVQSNNYFESFSQRSLGQNNETPMPSNATGTGSGGGLLRSAARPRYDRSPPIMGQGTFNSLEPFLEEIHHSPQAINQDDQPVPRPRLPTFIEEARGQNLYGASNLIYPDPGDGEPFVLQDLLPVDVLALIAADPDIDTRSVYDDIARIIEDEVPHLRDYRYRLLSGGTVGVRQPPAVVEEVSRRRAGHGDVVEAADTVQDEADQAVLAEVLTGRLALPAEVELPPPASIHLGSAADTPTADAISAIDDEIAQTLRHRLELPAGTDQHRAARAITGK